MAKLTVHQIRTLARSIIARNPGGIRYSELVDTISRQNPETPKNTVHGSVWNLEALFPNEIAKPSRGIRAPIARPANDSAVVGTTEQLVATGIKVKESDFTNHSPFGLRTI